MKKILNIFLWVFKKLWGTVRWYFRLFKGRAWYTRLLLAIGGFIASLLIYLGMVDINFLWLFGKSPGFSQIMNPITSEASEIYSADGKLIGKFFNENRTPVKYNDVNPIFWAALIDTEDERFYSHYGIDPHGIMGALKDAVVHREPRGASTITQQLAKNMFRVRTHYSTGLLGNVPGLRMLIMKSKEWIIATKLEILYTKEEILTMYANTVDFGSNAYGIKTACKTYFNITPDQLTAEQAAVLVGMLKATTFYNPIVNPENSVKRRNVVLYNMVQQNDLSQAEFDSLKTIPLKLEYSVESNYDGQAQYFREAVANYLADWCSENGYDLYNSGLKIYTTIDTRMQKYAEEAALLQMRQVQKNFDNHWGKNEPWVDEEGHVIEGFIEDIAQKLPLYQQLEEQFNGNKDSIDYYLNLPHKVKLFDYEQGEIEREISTLDSIRYMVRYMHCAMLAMEPQTGAVKAWVGDVNFNAWKYDKVTAMRQPGSTFKLFVYTEAMNQGLTPCDKRRDEFLSLQLYDKQKGREVTWTPTNSDGHFTGDSIPLKSAFARSINTVAVRLGMEMGIRRVIETAHKMGIHSELEEAPSLALGSSDVNLLELVNAYCTVADNGMHHEPLLVTRILDKEGNEVYTGIISNEQAIPYKSAFFMQQLLQGGMREPGGTSHALWQYVGGASDTDFGGKTGTSNNNSDGWFMAVSPKLVVGAWVGGEYRSIHFRTGALGQGSRTALPICGLFLQRVLSDNRLRQYHARFDRPRDRDILNDMFQCESYYGQEADSLDVDSISMQKGEGEDGMQPSRDPIDRVQPREEEVTLDKL